MSLKNKSYKLLLLPTLLFCAPICEAQTQAPALPQVAPVEQLADKSWIATINGLEHRCILPAQLRQLLLVKAERDLLAKEQALLLEQIADLKQQNALHLQMEQFADDQKQQQQQQLSLLQATNQSLTSLLADALRLSNRSRVSGFFDRPLVQIIYKGVLPLAGLALAATR